MKFPKKSLAWYANEIIYTYYCYKRKKTSINLKTHTNLIQEFNQRDFPKAPSLYQALIHFLNACQHFDAHKNHSRFNRHFLYFSRQGGRLKQIRNNALLKLSEELEYYKKSYHETGMSAADDMLPMLPYHPAILRGHLLLNPQENIYEYQPLLKHGIVAYLTEDGRYIIDARQAKLPNDHLQSHIVGLQYSIVKANQLSEPNYLYSEILTTNNEIHIQLHETLQPKPQYNNFIYDDEWYHASSRLECSDHIWQRSEHEPWWDEKAQRHIANNLQTTFRFQTPYFKSSLTSAWPISGFFHYLLKSVKEQLYNIHIHAAIRVDYDHALNHHTVARQPAKFKNYLSWVEQDIQNNAQQLFRNNFLYVFISIHEKPELGIHLMRFQIQQHNLVDVNHLYNGKIINRYQPPESLTASSLDNTPSLISRFFSTLMEFLWSVIRYCYRKLNSSLNDNLMEPLRLNSA
ncbi:MAG: hypothetical protein KIT27_01540 [Legionellales bacterium]|nr:hypothetical protein [Legionellales bacterium]